ncbi:MAG: hypothetical protein I3273_01290 [Candidatus Moeniiplasma glomeromycotorum]|nr:hypothetical protein [Candidatus Moeniiplasma glomeromycotorum]MCE8167244.1 hypothetical protein [Candidatus Moeniiplasma glomeromycotorum]MCE8168743.1 hypothetical protein [Candidatus Moeniiplasma glomeromycotorum]
MSKKLKVLIILSLVAILGGSAAVYLVQKSKNSSLSNSLSKNTPKKELADKIKTDLRERIERIKNGGDNLDDLSPYAIFDNYFACIIKGGLGFVKEREKIFPNDIGSKNYQEITNLIKQIDTEREKYIKQRKQAADRKLTNDPNLFYNAFETIFSGEVGPFPNWGFNGRQEGKEYCLIIPKKHPIFANFYISRGDLLKYYHITGTENIPLVPSPMDGTGLFKIVKLTDKITIQQCSPF